MRTRGRNRRRREEVKPLDMNILVKQIWDRLNSLMGGLAHRLVADDLELIRIVNRNANEVFFLEDICSSGSTLTAMSSQ